jgi:hypothetical protein
MNRLNDFINKLRVADENYHDHEIAAGLGNGDIERPEWMGYSESTDHVKLWDAEDGGSAQMGFVQLDYAQATAD